MSGATSDFERSVYEAMLPKLQYSEKDKEIIKSMLMEYVYGEEDEEPSVVDIATIETIEE